MREFTLVCGVLALLLSGILAADRYRTGMTFGISLWSFGLLPGFLLAFLGSVAGSVWLVVSVIGRRTRPVWLLMLALPVVCVVLRSLPIPGYVDGMADRLRRDFTREEWLRFAEHARAMNEDGRGRGILGPDMEVLGEAHPKIAALSEMDARVSVRGRSVDLLYGGSLAGEWGVKITGGNDPADPLATTEHAVGREAFPGVWVYELID